MGPRRQIKGTYSKVHRAKVTEEDCHKRYKERKVIPNFDSLFLRKSGNKGDSANDPFDCLVDHKKLPDILEDSYKRSDAKSFRKQFCVSNILTNSTFGSVGHSSANDTFDCLVKIKGLPVRTAQKVSEVLSSSSSVTDTTGILYHSLKSNAQSFAHSSTDENSKLQSIKNDTDYIKKPLSKGQPDLSCANKENKALNNKCNRYTKTEQYSSDLFSCGEENEVECKISSTNLKTEARSPQLFSSEDEIADKNNQIYHPTRRKKEISRTKTTREISANVHNRSGLSVFKKPGIAVEEINSSVVHPDNIGEFSCTPKYNNVAKVLLNGQLLSSQKRSLSASQFSSGSQKSGKSSERSALTSTPIENNRIRSFNDTFILWDNDNKAISPVQQEESKLSRAFSPAVYQSPLLDDLKTLSSKSKKSGDNPSNVSTYHSCKSSCLVSSSCSKNTPLLLKGNDFEKQKAAASSADVPSDEHINCKRLELKNDPLKTAIIPAFDASGELDSLSPSDKSLNTSCDGGPDSKAIMPRGTVSKKSLKIVSDTGRVCSDDVFHEITNISSRRVREINSFLSHPGIGVSLRKKRQKRKYSVNKVKPLPIVKRLTRQSVRISEVQKSQAEKNYMIQCENGNTDDSTTTEPSFFKPKKRPPNLKKKQPSVAVEFNTRKRSSLRMAVADSSRDSLASSRENCALGRSASKSPEVLNRRTSRRLAIRRKTELQQSSYSRKELRSTDESMSSRSMKRKSNDINKKLNSLSVKGKNSDCEESKFSIASKSERESLYSTPDKKVEFSGCEDIEEESALSIESIVLDNVSRNQIEKESEDSHVTEGDLREKSDVRQTRNSIIVQKKPCDMSVTNNCGMSNHDISSLEDFDNQFKTTMLSKRGKGWIRSLSVAKASMYGPDQFGDIRRKTVHRMSIGRRRITHFSTSGFEASWSSIKEEGYYNQQGEYLSQSILEDPQRHVLALCSQTEPVPITECFTESRLSCCKKIGEGVYGEVFMTKPNPHNMDGATVLKIMPIEGDFEVNGEPQKHFSEILSEIIISLELSNLQKSKEEQNNWTENFVHVLNCWCVKGSYHQDMLHLWDIFHEEKGSENDRPDIFPDTQLHIVLEFSHGGRDLEGFVFNNAGQAHAIFLQIAYTLAVAEQQLEFEHRDLHWGNVLIATTTKNYVEFKLNEGTYCLETKGVVATVIDFTLSRLKTPHCVMYNNLAEDPSLFTAEGDYQFEIYRQMKKVNRNNWEKFTPYTNILWLHYIVDKMINECYYKNAKSRVHKSGLVLLRKLKDTILDSESAVDFVLRREHPE